MRGLGGHTSSQGNRQDRDTQIRNRASGAPPVPTSPSVFPSFSSDPEHTVHNLYRSMWTFLIFVKTKQ